MSEIEKMERYIELTDIPSSVERYSIGTDQILALRSLDVFRIIVLAFDYGRAKGYRMAKAEVQG